MNLVGSKAVVFGGSDGTECFSDLWALDLDSLVWTEIKDPALDNSGGAVALRPLLAHTTTTVGSYLFVLAGHNGADFTNDLLAFNLGEASNYLSVALPVHGLLIPNLAPPLPRLLAVTLAWEHKPTYGMPPSPRGYHSAILADSRLLVCGGFEGSGVFEEVWCLDLGGSSFLPQITNWAIVLPEDEENGKGEEAMERR